MRHNPVVIGFDELIGRMWEHFADVDIAEALCVDSIDDFEAENVWFVVTWPEHVLNPLYNGDANYAGPYTTQEEALCEYEGEVVNVYGD